VASSTTRTGQRSLDLNGAERLAGVIFKQMEVKHQLTGAADRRDRSRETWRWSLQPQIGARNRSPEVVLERMIARACQAQRRMDWANQVPTASGLTTAAGDRRRALDLVRQRGPRHYKFIELKIASNTPLSAAIEVIGYACLWLLARRHPPSRSPALLTADHIDLRVLAAASFYGEADLASMRVALDQSVAELGATQGAALTICFDVLPDHLTQPLLIGDDVDVLASLERRGSLAS